MYEEVLAHSRSAMSRNEEMSVSYNELNREYQLLVKRKKEVEELLGKHQAEGARLSRDNVWLLFSFSSLPVVECGGVRLHVLGHPDFCLALSPNRAEPLAGRAAQDGH